MEWGRTLCVKVGNCTLPGATDGTQSVAYQAGAEDGLVDGGCDGHVGWDVEGGIARQEGGVDAMEGGFQLEDWSVSRYEANWNRLRAVIVVS
jgi:hypothetical protein